jgi:tripartite-type tricarboxylate transporter receptor subunit TctC
MAVAMIARLSPACIATAAAAEADSAYPARSIHLVVSFPAGTAVDTLARLVGAKLANALEQPVVVENRPGAAGNIGTTYAARAPADGYTLAVVGAAVTINPTLYGSRAVDPISAFAPIIQLTNQPIVLVAHPLLPATSLPQMIELARRKPGQLAYSTPGVGTPTHIAAELLAMRAGITWLHVPYAGSGPLLTDVLSGEVPLSFTLLGSAEPFLRSGQLRAIAVSTDRRVHALPAVPTVAESGFADYEITSWHGIVAPAGTPPAVVERLQRELAAILLDPDIVARLRTLGMEPAAGTSSAFRARIVAESERWKAVIREAGIPMQQ